MDWDIRFLELARTISTYSKDPSTKVGSVIVDNSRRIISTGYNGFPQHVPDHLERYQNRDMKLAITIHAETNAILFAKCDLEGMTIYTYPMIPCSHCSALIIQSGIERIVSVHNGHPKWEESVKYSKLIFEESGIILDLYKENGSFFRSVGV